MGGQPGYKVKKRDEAEEVQLAPVQPFCLLSRKFLPKQARQVYSLSWLPIFKLMQSEPTMDLKLDAQESFKIGYEYLKSRVEYIFNSARMKPDTWCVAYWSVKVQRSSIMKFGTVLDKARLPEANKRNKAGINIIEQIVLIIREEIQQETQEVIPQEPQEVILQEPQFTNNKTIVTRIVIYTNTQIIKLIAR